MQTDGQASKKFLCWSLTTQQCSLVRSVTLFLNISGLKNLFLARNHTSDVSADFNELDVLRCASTKFSYAASNLVVRWVVRKHMTDHL